jgi:hypothetical protein
MERDRFLSPDIALIETGLLEPDWLGGIEAALR